MKKMLSGLVFFILLMISTVLHASDIWLGDILIEEISPTRGYNNLGPYEGHPIYLNLATHDQINLSFDFYKRGITESGDNIWRKIRAEAQLVNDRTNEVIKQKFIPIIGRDGNNVIYKVNLDQFSPVTCNLPIELRNNGNMKTHLNIMMNGIKMLTIPVILSYQPY